MRPRDAAVMPLPSEEVTPPVTNTNFGTTWTSGLFLCYSARRSRSRSTRIKSRSFNRERQAVQHDKSRSIVAGVRRVGRDLDGRVLPAVIEPSIEPQRAEARVAKLSVLKAGVLDDRHKARPHEPESRLQRDRRGERRSLVHEVARRPVEPYA